MKTLLLALTILFAISCSEVDSNNWTAKVESNCKWSGSFNGSTVDGSGNQTIDLGSDEIVCCVVQKQVEKGSLKVTVGSNSKSTTAAYGVVSVCNK